MWRLNGRAAQNFFLSIACITGIIHLQMRSLWDVDLAKFHQGPTRRRFAPCCYIMGLILLEYYGHLGHETEKADFGIPREYVC